MDSSKESVKGYVKYSFFAIQMGVIIYLGAYFGKKMDEIYPMEKKWFTMLFVMVAVALSLYNLLRQLKNEEKKDKEK